MQHNDRKALYLLRVDEGWIDNLRILRSAFLP